jgi:PAS domain S-box-containing protein
MDAPFHTAAEDVTRLRDCLNELASLIARPVLSTGGDPGRVASSLADALVGMLPLTFVCVRLNDPDGGPSLETMRVAEPSRDAARGEGALASARVGPGGEIGIVVVGSRELDFPSDTDTLLLNVAVNQAALGLQHARLLRDRKRLVSDRSERERESSAIMDTIPGLVAMLTPGGEVDVVNHELVEYCGQPLEAMKNWGTNGTVHADDVPRVGRLFTQAIASGEPYDFEARIRRFDEVYRWCQIRGLPHRDTGGRVVRWFVLLTDIDDRKRAEEALSRARFELAHVSRVTTLSALTASIAHEVNQPLSGIITNAGTCLRMLAADPPDIDGARDTARRTIRDGNRASDVITRLRALFSKKEFTLEPLDLNDAAREVIALSSNDLQRNRVILQSELVDGLPTITGDRIQLQQVILNLLRNASEAMVDVHDRPRHLLIKTEREDGGRVRLTVLDVGVGLSPLGMSSLFDAFYTTKNGGMGIGLFVSRSIVEKHQGRLWAQPNEGSGATFSFSIPCGLTAGT